VSDSKSISLTPVSVRTDHEEAPHGSAQLDGEIKECTRYVVGDTVSFHVSNGEGLPYRITWDGKKLIDEGTVSNGKVSIRIDEPGIVRCTVGGGEGPVVEAAVAVSPEQIAPGLPEPDDFMEFWQRQLKRLENRSKPVIEPYKDHGTDLIYKLQVDSGDPDVGTGYAWLHVPPGDGPFPVVVRAHGAGVYSVPEENSREWAQYGCMCLSLNAHPIPNDMPSEYYDDLREGALATYRFDGREDRESLYFVQMFLRNIMFIRAVADLEKWDGETLISEGHSQGGGQAIAAAALGENVTGMILSCPTHCDHAAPLNGRPAGWPQIVEWTDDVPDPAQLEATRYIDGVNFARHVDVPTLIGVCYLDTLCTPTGVFAAHNLVTGPRTVHLEPTIAHIYTEGMHDATFRWADANIMRRS
jgi:cephalosporin-C deacetylase